MSANDDLGITIPVNRPVSVDELAATIKAQPTSRSAPSVIAQQPEGANPDAPVPFVFGDEIARGGMGSILKAEDCKLGRTIAVKIMLSEIDADEDQKQRFINEAYVLARLEHPNVVPIHDIGRDSEGQLYYTMKPVKGRTLQAIINDLRNEAPEALKHYTLSHLLTIFRKVCDAMAFAHSQDIIHRDLKPENIMVGEFGEVLVMDWGLAKMLGRKEEVGRMLRSREANDEEVSSENSSFSLPPSSLAATLQGAVMGTPQYMIPEQAEGRIADMDARSDIFSLGGILYALLTLRPPIEGKTLDEVLQRVISGSITSPSLFEATATKGQPAVKGEVLEARKLTPLPHLPGGRVPAALSAVVMKALCVDKAKRYQDINALSTDIEKYEGGFATGAEQAGAWTQLMLLVKRNRAASIGVAAVLLVGGILGTKAVIEGRRAERGEARALRGEADARATLADLRRTAPVFYAQAKVDFQDGKLKEAIEKLGYAIQLDETAADYHLLRADLRQSSEHLVEAAEGYRRVLALRPADKSATTNLALCEKLLKESGGAALNRDQKLQLLAALRAQKRQIEAVPLAALLDPDINAARTAVLSRLRELRGQKGRTDWAVSSLPDGTCGINFQDLTLPDFSVLKGLPVTEMAFRDNPISDLSTLAGLPLRKLEFLNSTKVSDLSPLRGMPLETLIISDGKGNAPSPVADLTPLRGMKLKKLVLQRTAVTDLSPLAGMPLEELQVNICRVRDLTPLAQCKHLRKLQIRELPVSDLGPLAGLPLTELDCYRSPITSLAALAGMPLKRLSLVASGKVTDLNALAQCPQLEFLDLNGNPVTDLGPLAKLPLKELGVGQTRVVNLSPLAECVTLERIDLPNPYHPIALDLSALRHLPRLKFIRNVQQLPAEEFWKEYDASKAAPPK
jgi:serine/threonine protein kinase/Flp pilus assembly protein TadD